MTLRIGGLWFAMVVIAIAIMFHAGLRFNADIFGLLPQNSTTVKGLRDYQSRFASSQALILAFSGEDSDAVVRSVDTVAQRLVSRGLSKNAIWRSPWAGEQAALAEFVAYLWLNELPEAVEELLAGFSPPLLEQKLSDAVEKMATSFDAGEIARTANDPFNLTAIVTRLANDRQRDPFSSKDGRFRILYLPYPEEHGGFWQYRIWLKQIDQEILEAREDGVLDARIHVSKTGNPVFVSEFGSRLLRDLLFAAGSTLILVVLLFWWAHRRWSPLLYLVILLGTTLILTIAFGSLFFSSLSLVSLGFAAILMGLTVDYGLIAYQEYRSNPKRSLAQMRRVLAPSILWAAVTTAGAFFMMARSSLPGLTQLGVLVALGILCAAVLVLWLYLPAVCRTAPENSSRRFFSPPFLRPLLWPVTLIGLLGSVGIVLLLPPGIETRVTALQYQDAKARQVQTQIQEKLDNNQNDHWLIIDGADESVVRERLLAIDELLRTLPYEVPVQLPLDFWPDAQAQRQNRPRLNALAKRYSEVQRASDDAGFTEESMALTREVFSHWSAQENSSSAVMWPTSESSRWLISQFASRDEAGLLALGSLTVDERVPQEARTRLYTDLNSLEGVTQAAWPLLTDALADNMLRDARNVIVPMLLFLVIFLGLAFRDMRSIALSFATLAFSMLCLSAVMSLLGWSWNIMNLTALPLLLGAGVDYSIHIQLALKRFAGDRVKVYRSVGLAILLCGASTTAAFGSLGLASNPGLASLGQVTALGIAIACLTAVFLLPGWWLALRGRIPKEKILRTNDE